MARLAIITICYNDREGLARTFASVFGQSVHDIEYIVVDGGSSDGSVAFIQQHADRITHWTSEPDRGIYDAQNKGWHRASAPFVLFLNAGDTFAAPDVLERTVPLLIDGVDILYGDAQLADERGVYRVKRHPRRMSSAWLMKEVVSHSAQFIRRSVLERYDGYDTRYRIAADYALFAQAYWKGRAVVRKTELIVSVFDTQGLSSDPSQKGRVAMERKAIQRSYAPCFWYAVYHAYAALNRIIGR